MPETKFTAGPWHVYDENEGENPPRTFWCIANDAFHNGGEDDAAFQAGVLCGNKDDAHLIAAAPDLYAALEQSAHALELVHPLLADRRLWPDTCFTPSIQTCNCALATKYKSVLAALAKARGES